MSNPKESPEVRIARSLILHAANNGAGPYLARYLAQHVASADLWTELAASQAVLDALSPDTVAVEAFRSDNRSETLPPPVLVTMASNDDIQRARPEERPLLRALMANRLRVDQTWNQIPRLRWANLMQVHPSLPLGGHPGGITKIAFGTISDKLVVLAAGTAGGQIRIWNPATGKQTGEIAAHNRAVSTLAFASLADGSAVLASSAESDELRVRLWNPESGAPVESIPTLAGRVTAVTFGQLADGKRILAIGTSLSEHRIRLLSLQDFSQIGDVKGHLGGVRALVAGTSPFGQVLLASGGGFGDSRVRVWNLADRSLVSELPGHLGGVTGLAFGTGNNRQLVLATASRTYGRINESTIQIWDPLTAKRIRALPSQNGNVAALAFSHSGPVSDQLAIGTIGPDGTGIVNIWTDEDGSKPATSIRAHAGEVSALAFGSLPDGRPILATGGASGDGLVKLWNPVAPQTNTDGKPNRPTLKGAVNTLAIGPSSAGETLLATAQGSALQIWKASSGEFVAEWFQPGEIAEIALGFPEPGKVTIIRNARHAVAAPAPIDSKVLVLDLDSGAREMEIHTTSTLRYSAFGRTNDGRSILAAAPENTGGGVQVWDLNTGEEIGRVAIPHCKVLALSFHKALGSWPMLVIATDRNPGHPLPGVDIRSPYDSQQGISFVVGEIVGMAAATLPNGKSVLAVGRRGYLGSASNVSILRESLDTTWITVPNMSEPTVEFEFGTLEDGRPILALAGQTGNVVVWEIDPMGNLHLACGYRLSPSKALKLVLGQNGSLFVGCNDGLVALGLDPPSEPSLADWGE